MTHLDFYTKYFIGNYEFSKILITAVVLHDKQCSTSYQVWYNRLHCAY